MECKFNMLTHFSEVMMRSYVWELYIGVKMSQMLDIITANSGQISKEKAEALKEIFPDELPASSTSTSEIEYFPSGIKD